MPENLSVKAPSARNHGVDLLRNLSMFMVVMLFANMHVPKWLAKVSAIFAPVSFGVYLIHLHPFVHDYVMLDVFVSLAKLPAWTMIPLSIGLTVGIFLLCSAIDYVRLGLFRLLRVKQLLVKLENKLFPNNGGSQ